MKMNMKHTGMALILGAALAATTASADNILYDAPWVHDPGAWENANYSGIGSLAQTFTTGNEALILTNVDIWIRNTRYPSDSSSQAGTLSVFLYATDSGNGYRPTGSSLYTITSGQTIGAWYDNGPGAGYGTHYTNLNFTLAPNTTYAISFEAAVSTTIGWKYNTAGHSPTSSISPTPTFYNWEWDGANWVDADPGDGFSMTVAAAAVPEPATGHFIALGLGLLIGVHQWRRRM